MDNDKKFMLPPIAGNTNAPKLSGGGVVRSSGKLPPIPTRFFLTKNLTKEWIKAHSSAPTDLRKMSLNELIKVSQTSVMEFLKQQPLEPIKFIRYLAKKNSKTALTYDQKEAIVKAWASNFENVIRRSHDEGFIKIKNFLLKTEEEKEKDELAKYFKDFGKNFTEVLTLYLKKAIAENARFQSYPACPEKVDGQPNLPDLRYETARTEVNILSNMRGKKPVSTVILTTVPENVDNVSKSPNIEFTQLETAAFSRKGGHQQRKFTIHQQVVGQQNENQR